MLWIIWVNCDSIFALFLEKMFTMDVFDNVLVEKIFLCDIGIKIVSLQGIKIVGKQALRRLL
jgi:hypothetical protein